MPTCPAGHDVRHRRLLRRLRRCRWRRRRPPAPRRRAPPSAARAAAGRCERRGSARTAGTTACRPAHRAPGPLRAPVGAGSGGRRPRTAAWFAEVAAGEGPDTASLPFPQYCPERRFGLAGAQMTIGRRSRSRGVDPEIDLSGPPLDPGVSTLHAMLLAPRRRLGPRGPRLHQRHRGRRRSRPDRRRHARSRSPTATGSRSAPGRRSVTRYR